MKYVSKMLHYNSDPGTDKKNICARAEIICSI